LRADLADTRFSLVVGGPFYVLLRRLRLTGPDELPTRRAALVLTLLAWLPPVVLAIAQTLADEGYSGWAIFADPTVYTRYLIAVWMMVATERYAESRLMLLIRQFRDSQILPDDVVPSFFRALARADRLSASPVAEGAILVAVLVWSTLIENYIVEQARVTWEGKLVGDAIVLSWAGQATRFLSNPLFLFLVLRWVWRFAVWTDLLLRISRLRLQLAPLHADRSGGLGFLTVYPTIFNGFVFALSCVIASSILKELDFVRHENQSVWWALAGWLAFSQALLLGPLLVFARPLYQARERALFEYGRLASECHLAFHRKWIEETRSGDELLASSDASAISDLNASVEVIRRLRVLPVDRATAVQLVVAAGAPLIAVVLALIPAVEIARWLAGAIF